MTGASTTVSARLMTAPDTNDPDPIDPLMVMLSLPAFILPRQLTYLNLSIRDALMFKLVYVHNLY